MMNEEINYSDIMLEIKELNHIHSTWENYCLMLLNSTADPLRSIWREKIVTSIIHCEFNVGSISENNLAGLEILSSLPKELTEKIVDDYYTFDTWEKDGRLVGSKRMKVKIGHYPQESLSNEANLCIKYIVKHWNKHKDLIFKNELLKRIWDFSQMSNGNCLYPDEVLTYTLERFLDPKKNGNWIDACIGIYTDGIPSNKFKKYYFADKLEGFPFDENDNIELCKKNFLNVCDVILKEDVTSCPSWKRIGICILRNDVSMRYAGFSMTHRERTARENALNAFDRILNENI